SSTRPLLLNSTGRSTPFYPRSPFGVNFVTRKISRSVAKVHLGQLESISLGSLHSKRDWDHAKDYAEVFVSVCVYTLPPVRDTLG
uniref:GDP-D-mannose dehydratase n=1 Tax=Oncorhynchus tshawytscha TaxID=74940 RepID=A0AAZ3QDF9_ONCTS